MVVQDEKKEIIKKSNSKKEINIEENTKQELDEKNIDIKNKQSKKNKEIKAKNSTETTTKTKSSQKNNKKTNEKKTQKNAKNENDQTKDTKEKTSKKNEQRKDSNVKTINKSEGEENKIKGNDKTEIKNKTKVEQQNETKTKPKKQTKTQPNKKDEDNKKIETIKEEETEEEKKERKTKPIKEEKSKAKKNKKNVENNKIKNETNMALEKKDKDIIVKDAQDTEKNKKNVGVYVSIFIGILLLILVIVFIVFSIRNYVKNDVISNGIYIYGVDVSNMSKAEAETVLSQTFEEVLEQNIVLVSDEDYETYIEASEIDLEYDISSAVDYAYQIGKNGNLFTDNYEILNTMINGINITPTYSIDEEKLTTILDGLSADLPNAVVEGSYYIEDTTLVITKGTDGYIVNVEETLEKVKESIESFDYLENSITLVLSEQSPEEIDLDAIYEEVYQEATDAYYTTDPYAVYPSSTGLDFSISLDEAKELLEEAESECEIALTVLYPSVTTNDIEGDAFPDLLASYTTKYDTSNTNRVTNLKLAANKINGTVLLSGDTFSYNQVVGERTIAAGYKEAGIYLNGEETTGLGGGICQISTTLFNAALLANLEMVEVHNHQMIPSYSSAGRDATVVYGTKDFQFSNSRNYAIKIECSVSGGVVSFKIYGVEEETEYDVSISAKITSQTSSYIKSKTYRTLSLNGETVSTELIYSCTYKVSD